MKINRKIYDNVERAVCKYHELYAGAARIARDIVGPWVDPPPPKRPLDVICNRGRIVSFP